MTATKVALSIPAEILNEAKKEVRAGRAKSLSAFVSVALDEKLQRAALASVLDRMDAEHGAPKKADRTWAKSVLK